MHVPALWAAQRGAKAFTVRGVPTIRGFLKGLATECPNRRDVCGDAERACALREEFEISTDFEGRRVTDLALYR